MTKNDKDRRSADDPRALAVRFVIIGFAVVAAILAGIMVGYSSYGIR